MEGEKKEMEMEMQEEMEMDDDDDDIDLARLYVAMCRGEPVMEPNLESTRDLDLDLDLRGVFANDDDDANASQVVVPETFPSYLFPEPSSPLCDVILATYGASDGGGGGSGGGGGGGGDDVSEGVVVKVIGDDVGEKEEKEEEIEREVVVAGNEDVGGDIMVMTTSPFVDVEVGEVGEVGGGQGGQGGPGEGIITVIRVDSQEAPRRVAVVDSPSSPSHTAIPWCSCLLILILTLTLTLTLT
jgi:hypothetical protein